jgi:predicted amidophosphoribosyltransferase
VFATVFPTACSLCGRELVTAGWVDICSGCWRRLGHWKGPACERCGVPFVSELAVRDDDLAQTESGVCGRCRTGEYEFDLARSYGLYTGNLRAAILRLKFKRRERLGQRLGELLGLTLQPIADILRKTDFPREPPLLMPIPLHAARERGFNQSELLARGLAKALRSGGSRSAEAASPWEDVPRRVRADEGWSLDVQRHCLRRARATIPQSGLSLSARRENVRGVFEVLKPELIRDRTVIVVDDVMTTGATLSACAAALKRSGARYVVALTLAHATAQFPDTMYDGP